MTRLVLAYRPLKVHAHSIATDLAHPRVEGWLAHPVMRRRWNFIDVAPERESGR